MGDSGRLRGFADVPENFPHGACIADEGDDPHLRVADRASQCARNAASINYCHQEKKMACSSTDVLQ